MGGGDLLLFLTPSQPVSQTRSGGGLVKVEKLGQNSNYKKGRVIVGHIRLQTKDRVKEETALVGGDYCWQISKLPL